MSAARIVCVTLGLLLAAGCAHAPAPVPLTATWPTSADDYDAGAPGGPNDDADVTAEMLEASEREAVALITAAYTALLLGCVLRSAPEARQLAAKALPGGRLSPLSTVLVRLCGPAHRIGCANIED